MSIFLSLSDSKLSAMRRTREVCDQISDGRSLCSLGPRLSQLSVFFILMGGVPNVFARLELVSKLLAQMSCTSSVNDF